MCVLFDILLYNFYFVVTVIFYRLPYKIVIGNCDTMFILVIEYDINNRFVSIYSTFGFNVLF